MPVVNCLYTILLRLPNFQLVFSVLTRRCGGCPCCSTLFAFLRDLVARLLPFYLLFLFFFFLFSSFQAVILYSLLASFFTSKKVHLVHESCDTVFAILNVCFLYLPVVNSTQRQAWQ
ncbi:hypothetical protein BDW60DRAFT_68310 [Aspergillus nidulans var. acristatus]